jgi:hypothetical protein
MGLNSCYVFFAGRGLLMLGILAAFVGPTLAALLDFVRLAEDCS